MKSITRYLFCTCIVLAVVQKGYAQAKIVDSLTKELGKTDNDSVNIFLLLQIATKTLAYDSVKAHDYIERASRMANKLQWDYAYGAYYENKAFVNQMAMDNNGAERCFDSAIIYYQHSADAKRNKKEASDATLSIANCKGEKAEVLVARQRFKEAIGEYLMAVKAWQNSDQSSKYLAIGVYYAKISTIYYKLDQIDKALEYDKLSFALIEKTGTEEDQAYSLLYICDDYIRLHKLDSAFLYLDKAKPTVEKLNSFRLNVQYYNKIASISRQQKDFNKAIEYYGKTLSISRQHNDLYQLTASLKIIGLCYNQLGDFINARKQLLPALQTATENNYEIEKIEILKELVKTEKGTQMFEQAFRYLEQLDNIKDSSGISSTKKAIAETENKYKAAEKEQKIVQLEKDKQIQYLSIKQKSTLNYFLLGSVAALLIVLVLIYMNFRNRRQLASQHDELQQQQIRELQKDRQLVAVDSMLKGQEEERSRLAKDLHDGLGGLLSGVKFSLINMRDNFIVTPENMIVFERSLDMIDTSIKELRRVAHNMMPEMLTKFGLDEALKEYCNNVNTTKLLIVKYQSLGMEQRLENSIEISVYRIVQELLNNTMKHAAATEVYVQVIRESSRLNVVVEDNGKGFDPKTVEKNNGAGLANVRSRVNYLKGQLAIHAEPGKGTLVNIEFNL